MVIIWAFFAYIRVLESLGVFWGLLGSLGLGLGLEPWSWAQSWGLGLGGEQKLRYVCIFGVPSYTTNTAGHPEAQNHNTVVHF